jgi:hypothetical protein
LRMKGSRIGTLSSTWRYITTRNGTAEHSRACQCTAWHACDMMSQAGGGLHHSMA